MNFEKKMKKHIDQTLDEIVPNPYLTTTPKAKKSRMPFWSKIAIPAATLAVAASVTAVILPNVLNQQKNGGAPTRNYSRNTPSKNEPPKSYINLPNEGYLNVAAPKMTHFPTKWSGDVFLTGPAAKTLKDFDRLFQMESNQNFVVSPASYLLGVGGVIAVSDGYNLDEFGLTNPQEEIKQLLTTTNGAWTNKENVYAQIDSGIFHQQVGSAFPFLDEKRQEVADMYIGTGVANLGNYLQQATDYFKEAVGLTIPIPDPKLRNSGIVTYGGLKIVDKSGFTPEMHDFYVNGKKTSVNCGLLASAKTGWSSKYYENDKYLVFNVPVNCSSLLIVLPHEGVPLESIKPSEAYENYVDPSNKNSFYYYGYLPFFHNQTFDLDLTSQVKSHMTGNELLYSKLLANGIPSSSLELIMLQSSDFTFDETGIKGESIMVHGGSSSGGSSRNPREINVDRPFYAINLIEDFPLFVNKVTKPEL